MVNLKKAMPIFIVLLLIVLVIGLLAYDNESINKKNAMKNTYEVKAIVLETDDSEMVKSGMSKLGIQRLIVTIIEGNHKGKEIQASNQLNGKLEYDNYYEPGDKIILAILEKNGEIKDAKSVDLYRQGWQLILFGLFVLCLIIYAGFTGLKALFSFIASLYVLWKFLIPGLLNGREPLLLASVVLTILSAIIIFSVAGLTKKGISAFFGTMCGLLVTISITMFFGDKLALMGMTSPFAETLMFSGHLDLNMRHIFYAAIIIGASGAAMDIAMDVSASMEEIKLKKPNISSKELITSGFNIGRAVIGTMTTTLLLAYSGGYLTLLMLFMTKNSSFVRIMNLKVVCAEIMRTVVGSIGLVLVAPITAIFAGWILTTDLSNIFNKSKDKNMAECTKIDGEIEIVADVANK